MNQYLRSLVDVRREELPLLLPLFLDYFLLLLASYILKSVASGLFLNRLGIEKLPFTYLLTAVATGLVAYFLGHLSARTSIQRLIEVSRWFLVGNMLALWGLFHITDWTWPYYALLIWMKVFPIFAATQFWIFANNSFDARQAKRLFGLLNLGGVMGAMAGGGVTMLLVHVLLAENLLLVAVAATILASVTFRLAVRWLPPLPQAATVKELRGFRALDMLRLSRKNRHLLAISALICVTAIVGKLVEYQFFGIAVAAYPNKEELTGFLGGFLGLYMSAAAFTIQFFLTGAILRRLGVGGALQLTPIAVGVGAAGVLAFPVIWTASVLRLLESSLRVTLNRTSLEILYLPIPPDIKNRTRIFVDSVVDALADGMAGVLLLGCTAWLFLSLREISLVTIVFAAIWLALAGFAFRAYMSTIRSSLAKRAIPIESAAEDISDANTIAVLKQALDSSNERQLVYALSLLQQTPEADLGNRLTNLLGHPSERVKIASFRVLSSRADRSALEQATSILAHSDEEVRVEAIHYLCKCDAAPVARLADFLNHRDLHVRLAGLRAARQYDYPCPIQAISSSWIQDLLNRPEPDSQTARAVVARALPFADLEAAQVNGLLTGLLHDADPNVVKEALGSAARVHDSELVPLLIAKLENRTTRGRAREALSGYGPRIVTDLKSYLANPQTRMGIRMVIPRLLSQMATPEAAGILVGCLPNSPMEMRYQILKALNRIRRDDPSVPIPEEQIDGEILEEARRYYRLRNCLRNNPDTQDPGGNLLNRTLRERLSQAQERLFRLLGLRYPPKEIYDVYQEIKGLHSRRRARAIEYLDNVLERPHQQLLLPLLEEDSWERLEPFGKSTFGLEALKFEGCLREMIQTEDRWVKMVAIYRAGELRIRSLEPDIRRATEDPDAAVNETATLALSRIAT